MSGTFTRARLEALVKDTLTQQLKLPPEEFARTASIRNDLEIDSLDIVELMFDLEKRFEIVIPDEDLLHIVTIGDLINYLLEKVQRTTRTGPQQAPPAPTNPPMDQP